ncbi:uncharacterized protein STEHIDRAFT_158650 [Stereum hirsutum FP-91666 SS1]|uniref:uncharacterized protein n=1 Tax=Stereum hirsutum (strain FP-91666) TaxID=721885 RepID=UPI000444A63D|nr:uncharacterized protein STEHIDRAFT_158650 [Stereum hirsutum FP-91666 SS1]EIM84947.1 hypothetical protein STEHIDRAFT_158650 [Stereum hirsutum FP-91666 SS1]
MASGVALSASPVGTDEAGRTVWQIAAATPTSGAAVSAFTGTATLVAGSSDSYMLYDNTSLDAMFGMSCSVEDGIALCELIGTNATTTSSGEVVRTTFVTTTTTITVTTRTVQGGTGTGTSSLPLITSLNSGVLPPLISTGNATATSTSATNVTFSANSTVTSATTTLSPSAVLITASVSTSYAKPTARATRRNAIGIGIGFTAVGLKKDRFGQDSEQQDWA